MILRQPSDLLQLLEAIQKALQDSTKPKLIAQLSNKSVEYMNKGNINNTIKLFSNMENGILPLNDTTLNLVKVRLINSFSSTIYHNPYIT